MVRNPGPVAGSGSGAYLLPHRAALLLAVTVPVAWSCNSLYCAPFMKADKPSNAVETKQPHHNRKVTGASACFIVPSGAVSPASQCLLPVPKPFPLAGIVCRTQSPRCIILSPVAFVQLLGATVYLNTSCLIAWPGDGRVDWGWAGRVWCGEDGGAGLQQRGFGVWQQLLNLGAVPSAVMLYFVATRDWHK